MSPQDLTNAIIGGINAGGEQFLEGTLAAALPIMWLAILGLHLGRPYMLDMIDRFTLRLGADLLWLIYVGLRDFLILSGVVMSFMFFFPDVVVGDQLPITGGFAAVALFAVLLVKLMGDPDHSARAYQLVTYLLGIGAACYFVPYVLGVQANGVVTGPFLDLSNWLVTSSNPVTAVAFCYVSIGLIGALAIVAIVYSLRTGGQPEEPSAAPASR
jgi:hypothetical protein